jgi:3-oxoacyl-[acyl-carrier protein] reductase
MDLPGKKAIVTGGLRGLGRAIVSRFVAEGAVVAVIDRDRESFAKFQADFPAAHCIACDISSFADVQAAICDYHAQFGAADILVNNAGLLYSAPLLRIADKGIERHDAAMWNKIIATDLTSVFNMTVCVAEKMVTSRRKAVIVNISSISAAGNAGQSAYSAAKAGVNALTMTWAKELSSFGIRVAAIAPGFSETESTREAVSASVLADVVAKVPLRRLGRPEEIAEAVVFVIKNDFFNGKILPIDGGLVI